MTPASARAKPATSDALQTVLATAWPAARQRDKHHVSPSSISGQEQAAENDQKHTHESHRRTEAIWSAKDGFSGGRDTGAP